MALAAFSAFVLVLAFNHEYWFDEAQAWNIARDNDIAGIIGMMKYEGHPPLWHFILKFFISVGCSYNALGLISWGISTVTAAVIIFALPVKPYFKAALLMSSGMLYVNSVISRVYCLINLLLVLIAWIYPRRGKHPLLFGLLVALLANTHICMCGLVGIIGIYMLVDYFKEIKSNSVKQNILNTLGLAVAGAGVVLLILPIMRSFGSNSYAAELTFTVGGILKSLISAPLQIIESGCSPNLPFFLGIILSAAALLLVVVVLVLLRKRRRVFAVMLVFTAFYLGVVGVIWYSQPNRGALYLFSLAVIYIMCGEIEPVNANEKSISSDSLVGKLQKLDCNTEKTVSVLLSAMLALSIPSGVKYAACDLCGEFTPYKSAARFIRNNISENALLVTDDDSYAAILTYLPERKIYSVKYNRFYTYCSHEVIDNAYDADKFIVNAGEYDEIYYIRRPFAQDVGFEEIYRNDNFIPFVLSSDSVAIYKAAPTDIVKFAALSQ